MTLRVRTYRLDARDPRVGGGSVPAGAHPSLRDPNEKPAEAAPDRPHSDG